MAKKNLFPALSPRKLIELYAGENGGAAATRDLLAFHLREGNIRTRAWHVWESSEPRLQTAWREEPDPEKFCRKGGALLSDFSVKRTDWWRSVDWASDVANWDFRKSRFLITLRNVPTKRLMIRGVRFHGGDVRDLFNPESKKRQLGAPRQVEQWRLFWHEIIRLILDGRSDLGLLSDPKYDSSKALSDAIFNAQRDGKLGLRPNLDALSIDVQKGLPFTLGSDAVKKEVDALRQRFGLTRPRSAAKNSLEEPQ